MINNTTKSAATKLAATLLLALAAVVVTETSATAQTAILGEVYGRGVHAFYAGQLQEANTYLSSAINAGIKDPRAYYFRGIVSSMRGSQYEAEADWRQGAELEAASGSNPAIGRSLSRFQGSARLKLEQIRQTARLQRLTTAATRSNVRRSELGMSAAPAMQAAPAMMKPAAPAEVTIDPPPTPPAADNPFADDGTNMAAGEPMIEADDALEGSMDNPFADDGGAAMGDAPAAGDPFGGAADAPAADPFGGAGGDAPAADPFGGGGGDAMDDPFGGSDPFGN